MTKIHWLLLFTIILAGCGSNNKPTLASKATITLHEWKNLSPQEKEDPFVMQRLEKPAKDRRKR